MDFFINTIILHDKFNDINIKKLFEQAHNEGFKLYKFLKHEKYLTPSEATETALEGKYDYIFKSWNPNSIVLLGHKFDIKIWIHDKEGLLSMSIDTDESKTFEDEDEIIYPDSHFYLREALKLVNPFCIKSIETVTMY